MKFSNFLLSVALLGALATLGCGDETGSGGSAGSGGTAGSGGSSNGDVCNVGSCVDNSTLRQACETAVAACELTLEGDLLQTCINGAIADACTE